MRQANIDSSQMQQNQNPIQTCLQSFLSQLHIQEQPASIKARGTIPSDLAYFDGHFPGRPILPAVAMIDISIAILNQVISQKHIHKKLRLQELKNSKFTSPVSPGLAVEIELIRSSDFDWSVNWSSHENDLVQSLASLRLILTDA